VASVRHLPESDLGASSKENILRAVGDDLHKGSSHFIYSQNTTFPKSERRCTSSLHLYFF
jgi:hypothetical protein